MKSPDRKRALELSFEMGFVEGTIAATQRRAELSKDVNADVAKLASAVESFFKTEDQIDIATSELKQAEHNLVAIDESMKRVEGKIRDLSNHLLELKQSHKNAKAAWLEKAKAQDEIMKDYQRSTAIAGMVDDIVFQFHVEVGTIQGNLSHELGQLLLDRQRYALGLQSIISAEEVSEEAPRPDLIAERGDKSRP